MLEGIPASLIEGRLLEAIPKAERGVVSCGGGSQPLAPGGPGSRPPGTTTWLRGARCTETEARPRVKNRHGGAPRGERPALCDARRLASAWRAASWHAPTGASHAPERLSALRPPLNGGEWPPPPGLWRPCSLARRRFSEGGRRQRGKARTQ